jgi:predicted hotdog family 3-hydroxylacyl-ACP dehydratase
VNLPVATSDLESLIPHRPPIRWLDSLIECTETDAKATVAFSKDHFAANDGKVSESALVECVAQTVAAALGWRSRQKPAGSKPAGGMLAAISNFTFHQRAPLDTPLEIAVHEVRRLGPMVLISGRITAGSQLIAAGELSLYA